MNKIKMLTVAAVATLAIVGGTLSGCNRLFRYYDNYDNANLYTIGSTEYTSEVTGIDIDFVAGEVSLVASSSATKITIAETSATEDSEKLVRSAVFGNVLFIKYCEGGLSTVGCTSWSKNLTITLPQKVYSSLEFDGESCNFAATISSTTVDIDTVSGKLTYSGSATTVDIDTVSGVVEYTGDILGSLSVDSVSGKVTIDGNVSGNVNMDVLSGDIVLSGSILGKCDIETVSGNVSLSLSSSSIIDIESMSGNVSLSLATTGFSCRYSTRSGKFSSTFSCSVSGKVYTYGDGLKAIAVETMSGNLNIKNLEA